MLGTCAIPNSNSAVAIASTMNRNFRLVPTIERIIVGALLAWSFFFKISLRPIQLFRSDCHNHAAGGWAGRQDCLVPVDMVHRDGRPYEGQGFVARIGPGVALCVVQECSVGNHCSPRSVY